MMQSGRAGLLVEEALQSMENLPVYEVLSAATQIPETLRSIPEVVVKLKLEQVHLLSKESRII